jgi:hypothetical protein
VDHTEEQKAQFKQEFAVRRKRQMILAVPLVVLVLLAILSDRGGGAIFGIPRQTIGMGFFIFVVGALMFSFRNWRCPACDRYLGKGTPSYCPKCGVELQ